MTSIIMGIMEIFYPSISNSYLIHQRTISIRIPSNWRPRWHPMGVAVSGDRLPMVLVAISVTLAALVSRWNCGPKEGVGGMDSYDDYEEVTFLRANKYPNSIE